MLKGWFLLFSLSKWNNEFKKKNWGNTAVGQWSKPRKSGSKTLKSSFICVF